LQFSILNDEQVMKPGLLEYVLDGFERVVETDRYDALRHQIFYFHR
jgi:hypothetical protein